MKYTYSLIFQLYIPSDSAFIFQSSSLLQWSLHLNHMVISCKGTTTSQLLNKQHRSYKLREKLVKIILFFSLFHVLYLLCVQQFRSQMKLFIYYIACNVYNKHIVLLDVFQENGLLYWHISVLSGVLLAIQEEKWSLLIL